MEKEDKGVKEGVDDVDVDSNDGKRGNGGMKDQKIGGKRKSISNLKKKLVFHNLPKPPPRAESINSYSSRRSFPKSFSKSSSRVPSRIGSGLGEYSRNNIQSKDKRGPPSILTNGLDGEGCEDRDNRYNRDNDDDNDDDNDNDNNDDNGNTNNDPTFEPRFDKIPHFPLSQSELDYIALTPIELVIQNLRESMMSDVPIHNLEEEPENWADVSWYMISISSPIIAASIGPLANLCSTASVADTWRSSFSSPVTFPADLSWIYALNGISLFVGVISNLSLYMNFTGLINHRLSQLVSIGGWYIASIILLALIAASQYVYFNDGIYRRYCGFWYGVVAAILYFVGATLLLINEVGRRLNKSNVSLTMTRMQSRLMLLNVTFIFWIGMGGGIFTALIQGLTYGDAIYFCMGVCLTIAAGDILPVTHAARTVVIFYAYIGVLLIGLAIAAISSAIIESNGISLVYRKIESSRKKLYEKLLKDDKFSKMTSEEAFEMLRAIHKSDTKGANDQLAVKSLLLYSGFLFLGAMSFHLIEGWTYFQAIYFCALAFVANSFGDFTPKTPGGRTFFVVWAIGAVPMMTILISSLGSMIFRFLTQESDRITQFFVKITATIGKIGFFSSELRPAKIIQNKTKKFHNLFFELEREDTMGSQPIPMQNIRPGQPLFLRTASTITADESNESLFSGWPNSIISDDDDNDEEDEIAEELDEIESGKEEREEREEREGEDIQDVDEEVEEMEIERDRRRNLQKYDEAGEDSTYSAFHEDDNDYQPDNIAIPEGNIDQSDEDNIDFTDSDVLVHHDEPNTNEKEKTSEDDTIHNNDINSNNNNSNNNKKNSNPPSPSNSNSNLHHSISKIQTKRMLILTKQIRNLSQTLAQNPEQTYSYKEWVRLLKVIHLQVGINTPQFWLSPLTPLRVPIVESCFFLLTSLAALDEEVAQVIHIQKGTSPPHKRRERIGYFQTRPRPRIRSLT